MGAPIVSKQIDVFGFDLLIKLVRQQENADTSNTRTSLIENGKAALL